MINDLNVRRAERARTALVFLICAAVLAGVVVDAWFLALAAALIVVAVVSLWELVWFFATRRGVAFAALVVPLHLFYYLYCGAAFLYCWLVATVFRRRPALDPARSLSGSNLGE
jgi:hypothetical protein